MQQMLETSTVPTPPSRPHHHGHTQIPLLPRLVFMNIYIDITDMMTVCLLFGNTTSILYSYLKHTAIFLW
jgi:hypothetical protein